MHGRAGTVDTRVPVQICQATLPTVGFWFFSFSVYISLSLSFIFPVYISLNNDDVSFIKKHLINSQ